MENIKKTLADFVATYNDPKVNGDFGKTLGYFPELNGYDRKMLLDYIATVNDPKINGNVDKANQYFPEFFQAPFAAPNKFDFSGTASKKKVQEIQPKESESKSEESSSEFSGKPEGFYLFRDPFEVLRSMPKKYNPEQIPLATDEEKVNIAETNKYMQELVLPAEAIKDLEANKVKTPIATATGASISTRGDIGSEESFVEEWDKGREQKWREYYALDPIGRVKYATERQALDTAEKDLLAREKELLARKAKIGDIVSSKNTDTEEKQTMAIKTHRQKASEIDFELKEIEEAKASIQDYKDGIYKGSFSEVLGQFKRKGGKAVLQTVTLGMLDLYDELMKPGVMAKMDDIQKEEYNQTRANAKALIDSYGAEKTVPQEAAGVFLHSLPYMAEFATLGGLAKKATGKLGLELVKKSIGSGMKVGALSKPVARSLAVTTDVVDATLRSAVMASLSPSTYAEALRYKNGTTGYEVDENNQIVYTGQEDALPIGKALLKSAVVKIIENVSEMSGIAFSKMGKKLFPALNKWVNNPKIKNSELDDFVKTIGFNGTFNEFLEEQVATPLHAIFDGTAEFSDMFDPRQQLITLLGVAMPGAGFAMTGYGMNKAQQVAAKAKYRAARWRMFDELNTEGNISEDMLATLSNDILPYTNPDDMIGVVTKALGNEELTQKQQDAIDVFGRAVNNYKATSPQYRRKLEVESETRLKIRDDIKEANPEMDEKTLNNAVYLQYQINKLEGNKTVPGKLKKREYEQALNELLGVTEVTPEEITTEDITAEAQVDSEVFGLQDDQEVRITVKSLDEVPEQFRERVREVGGQDIKVRKTFHGIPYGKWSVEYTPKAYVYTATGAEIKEQYKQSKAKQDAIQEPTAAESVLRNEQPQMGLQEMGEGNAQEQAVTQEGQQEVVTPEVIVPEGEKAPVISQKVMESAGVTLPDTKVMIVDDVMASMDMVYDEAIKAGIPEDEAQEMRDAVTNMAAGNAVFRRDGTPFAIVVNKDQANSRTLGHELWHPLLSKAFNDNETEMAKFVSQIDQRLRAAGYSDIADKLRRFAAQYKKEGLEASEYMAEFGGYLSDEMANLERLGDKNKLSAFKKFIMSLKDYLNKLSQKLFKKPIFSEKAKEEDIIDLMMATSKQMKAGQKAEFKPKSESVVDEAREYVVSRQQKITKGTFENLPIPTQNIISLMENKFGIKAVISTNGLSDMAAYIDTNKKGETVIVISNDDPRAVLAAYSGLFVGMIRNQNKRLYSNIIKEVDNNAKLTERFEYYKAMNPAMGESFAMDATITEAMADYANDKINKKTGLYEAVKRIWNDITEFIEKSFQVKLSDINPSIGMDGLAKILVNPNIGISKETDTEEKEIKAREEYINRYTKKVSDFEILKNNVEKNKGQLGVFFPGEYDTSGYAVITDKKIANNLYGKFTKAIEYVKRSIEDNSVYIDIEAIFDYMVKETNMSGYVARQDIEDNFPHLNVRFGDDLFFDIYWSLKSDMIDYQLGIEGSKRRAIINALNPIQLKMNELSTIDSIYTFINSYEFRHRSRVFGIGEYEYPEIIEQVYVGVDQMESRTGKDTLDMIISMKEKEISRMSNVISDENHTFYSRRRKSINMNISGILDNYIVVGDSEVDNNGDRYVNVSFYSDRYGMVDMHTETGKSVVFSVMPKILDTVAEIFHDTSYSYVKFSPISGEGAKGRDERRGVYNIFARKLFGKYSVVAENEYGDVIPIPEMFSNKKISKNGYYISAETGEIKQAKAYSRQQKAEQVKPKKSKTGYEAISGYERMMTVIDGIIAKAHKRAKTEDNVRAYTDALAYMQGSKVYEDATDSQREELVIALRKRLGQKVAPSPMLKRITGEIKDIAEITIPEADALALVIKREAAAAKTAIKAQKEIAAKLIKELKDYVKRGKITQRQALNALNRLNKTNLFNDEAVDGFVEYMVAVFNKADYAQKLRDIDAKRKDALKAVNTKLGAAKDLIPILRKILPIKAHMIPSEKLDTFKAIVDILAANKAVLELPDIEILTSLSADVLNAMNEKYSVLSSLRDIFAVSENLVFDKDGKVDFPASVDAMFKAGEITESDKDLMRTRGSMDIIMGDLKEAKEPKTDEEKALEREANLDYIKSNEIEPERLANRDDRDAAKRLSKAVSTPGLDRLSDQDIKRLAAVIDNINAGYFPSSGLSLLEKISSNNRGLKVFGAFSTARMSSVVELYGNIRGALIRSDKGPIRNIIDSLPKNNLDLALGVHSGRDITNNTVKPIAEAYAIFKTAYDSIVHRLDKAVYRISQDYGYDNNKVQESKMRMMVYMLQREYESNIVNGVPDKQVSNPIDIIKATIKLYESGKKTIRGWEKSVEAMEAVIAKYKVEIDGVEMLNSTEMLKDFKPSEKSAIKLFTSIADELKDKSVYTSAVIRGSAIKPLNNWVHHITLETADDLKNTKGLSDIQEFQKRFNPSTRAGAFVERDGKVHPMHLDAFSAVEKGAKGVLLDYHLTSPIRETKRTMNSAFAMIQDEAEKEKYTLTGDELKKSKKRFAQRRKMFEAVDGAINETIEETIMNAFTSVSGIDKVLASAESAGYKAMLASSVKFLAEFTANFSGAIQFAPKEFLRGLTDKNITSMLNSDDGVQFMNNIRFAQQQRLYPSMNMDSKMVDTSEFKKTPGTGGGYMVSNAENKLMVAEAYIKKLTVAPAAMFADFMISTPDKVIARPVAFGLFFQEFERITGAVPDKDKIVANDEAYMDQYADAIQAASEYANEMSVRISATANPFLGIAKNLYNNKDRHAITQLLIRFNRMFTGFMVFEHVAAVEAVHNILARPGNMTMKRGRAAMLLAAITARGTLYMYLMKTGALMMSNFWLSMMGGPDDDDANKDQEKATWKMLTQSFLNYFSSIMFGRYFGNIVRGSQSYFMETLNKKYFDFLREDGQDYDMYRDAISMGYIPDQDKIKGSNMAWEIAKNFMGPLGPFVKMVDATTESLGRLEGKKQKTRTRGKEELLYRTPLELFGTLGYVPLYRDVRNLILTWMYKSNRTSGENSMTDEQIKKMLEEKYK